MSSVLPGLEPVLGWGMLGPLTKPGTQMSSPALGPSTKNRLGLHTNVVENQVTLKGLLSLV